MSSADGRAHRAMSTPLQAFLLVLNAGSSSKDPESVLLVLGHAGSMVQATHATLATFSMDLTREAEQRGVLDHVIVPGVESSPGFVSGHWTLDRDNSQSFVLLTFESAEHARAMASNVEANAENQRAAGIEPLSIQILEVTVMA